jgi:hypothetical protein
MSRTPRADLLALTPDDLASLTNRGTVKRAQKEIEEGVPALTLREEECGDLLFLWSDGVTCRFPAGRPVQHAVCSSGLAGISRHIVRSILAYQKAEAGNSATSDLTPPANEAADAPPPTPEAPQAGAGAPLQPGATWDPGAITDDELISCFRKPAILKARRRFESGVLVELTRGSKPVARFLDENCTVRFLVPGSLHYISADCAESAIPLWVPVAVWAFRELPPHRLAGLVSLQDAPLPVPGATLATLDTLLGELYRDGLNGVADSWSHRLGRMEQVMRDEGLAWPAEIVADLAHQFAMYRQHDARFEPRQVVQLLGELTARGRAIVNETHAVPQLMIRGTKSDRPAEIAGGRMIGLGLGVRPGRKHTTISAYLQDVDSGGVVAVERTFAEPPPEQSPRPFASLASTVLTRGVSLATLASSQLLVKSGKRTPSGLLALPRTAGSLATHPQDYRWEQLKPPLMAEGFAQLAERFATLPPSCLRPRRRTENLHVVAVERADAVAFDPAKQRLTARLADPQGGSATLVHPYHHRGREGFDALAQTLEARGDQVRFVAGHVRARGPTLEIQPIAVVLDDGQRRLALQPWLPSGAGIVAAEGPPPDDVPPERNPEADSPVEEFLLRLDDLLSEVLLTGLNLASAPAWTELAEVARQVGFARLNAPIAALADALLARADTLRWDPTPALRQARELCLLSRLASE